MQEKKETGVTLVALVVTIVILIILATISISIVFNEGGMVKQAEKAKEHQANAEAEDYKRIGMLDNNIKEYINGENDTDNSIKPVPKLADGMTPIIWNGTQWIDVDSSDTRWYDYSQKKWANVRLEDGSMLVWIPRFAYKITSGWHSATTGTIDVVFVGTDNKGKDGTVYNGTYSDAINGITSGGAMKNFVVNPAFDYGETKLEGFWIGKYESSHTGCTTDKTTGQVAFTGNEVIQIKANVTSWRNITTGEIFTTCLNMNRTSNPHGLNSNDNIVDPHMVKNTEWGAVAYLSKSKYGKQTEKIYINNSSDYITGNGANTADATETAGVTNAYNTPVGQKASATGNIYGVYDMNGGSWDRVAAYLDNEHENLMIYGNSIVTGAIKYKDIYIVGTTDTQELNYGKAAIKYGDAMYETSNGYSGANAWYGNWVNYAYDSAPFFARSGHYKDTSVSGPFAFGWDYGVAYTDQSFRIAISVI